MSEDQLFAAILADPDSDAPRLAYAANADRCGDPRGELIRLQIEWRDAMRDRREGRIIAPLWKRFQALLDQHKTKWKEPVAGLVDNARILRGFVEDIQLDAAAFLARADDLFRRAPIRHLCLTGVRAVVDQLASSPHLLHLVSLELTQNHLGDAAFRELVASPYLRRIRALRLRLNDLTRDGVEALAASDGLLDLEFVSLSGNRVEDPVEDYSEDEYTHEIITSSISLPPFGRELEAKYGYKKWLHGPSLLPTYPMLSDYI